MPWRISITRRPVMSLITDLLSLVERKVPRPRLTKNMSRLVRMLRTDLLNLEGRKMTRPRPMKNMKSQ